MLSRILNENEKQIKKFQNAFNKMDSNNILQVLNLMAISLGKQNVVVNSNLLTKTLFESIKLDLQYKNAFQKQNFTGYSIDQIGEIAEYNHAIKIIKTTRKQKVTDILRLHRQLLVDNSDLSYADRTALVIAVSKKKVSKSSVFNFVKNIKKENI